MNIFSMTRNGENRCRIDMCIHVYIGNYEAICGRKFVWHASTIHGTIYAMDSSSLFASSAKDRKLIQKFEKERGRVNSKIEIDGVKRYINERFIVRDGTWKNKRLASNVNNYTVNGIAYFSAERRTTEVNLRPAHFERAQYGRTRSVIGWKYISTRSTTFRSSYIRRMVGIEWTEKGERTVVTPSIDGPSYRWAQRCIIV